MHRIKRLVRVRNHIKSKSNFFTSKIFNSCAIVALALVVAAVLVVVGAALGLIWCHAVELGSKPIFTNGSW